MNPVNGIKVLTLMLALFSSTTHANAVAIFDEAAIKGLSCSWADCRACTQYRKICGGVSRNFSVLETEVLAAVAAEEAAESGPADQETDNSTPVDNQDDNPEETPEEFADDQNQTVPDEPTEDQNQTDPDEAAEDQNQVDPDEVALPADDPAPNDNHDSPAQDGDLEPIPALGWSGLALLFALTLLAGLLNYRARPLTARTSRRP